MINIINPLQIIIDICNKKYPSIDCSVEFVQDLYEKTQAYGETCWSDGKIYIQIDVNTPFIGIVEVFAHELAHVEVGYDNGHNEEWEKVFDDINKEFNNHMETLFID